MVAHLVRDEGVAGSNPATPTTDFSIEISTISARGLQNLSQRPPQKHTRADVRRENTKTPRLWREITAANLLALIDETVDSRLRLSKLIEQRTKRQAVSLRQGSKLRCQRHDVLRSRSRPASRSTGRIHISDVRYRAQFSLVKGSRSIHLPPRADMQCERDQGQF